MNIKKSNMLNSSFISPEKMKMGLNDNKMVKGFLLFVKTKKKTVAANKMLSSGKISIYDYKDYIKKIRKEDELIRNNIEFLDEILFETNDCTLSSVFEKGTIKYCINQYGMKEYYDDLKTAIENFVRVSI